MSQIVGEISFDPSRILGNGSTSTVYLGKFNGREVAVKKISKSKVKDFETEKQLLIVCDRHKNIVVNFKAESDSENLYIALELCHFTMKDYVQRADLKNIISRKEVIKQIFDGMEWLHSLGIGKSLNKL